MRLEDDLLLQGSGATRLGYGGIIIPNSSTPTTETVTIAAGHTLKMLDGSSLGVTGQEMQLVNHGQLVFDPELTANNMGAIRVTGSGITNHGEMIVLAGQTASDSERLEYYGPFNQAGGGSLTVDGWLLTGNDVTIADGILTGSGHINHYFNQLTVGPSATLDCGRDTKGLSFSYGTLALDSGATIQWRPGSGVANILWPDTLSLPAGQINVQVIPQGTTSLSGDYVFATAFSSILGSPSWNVTLPLGCTSDGVAIEGKNLVLKNLTGSFYSFDLPDLAELASAWLASAGQANYDEDCDFIDDNTIDLQDFAFLAENWQK